MAPSRSSSPGSSPLARGLHAFGRIDMRPVRIIPARAGFTPALRVQDVDVEDHPRSRGVYATPFPVPLPAVGSSPLARGLPRKLATATITSRIIPARAGFTDYRKGLIIISEDHPRSRGVYCFRGSCTRSPAGSSPLARGLPEAPVRLGEQVRIIPARAGFTAAPEGEPLPVRDHPRSRGVYGRPGGRTIARSGSSPLARGLLTREEESEDEVRIIPARAGFTWPDQRAARRRRDHPRSRGVYHDIQEAGARGRGSSPLARGLPTAPAVLALVTLDHPRSRGVYPMPTAPTCATTGSSPLARGLRLLRGVDIPVKGIIPARAGFTTRRPTRSPLCADHPRSRGVYMTTVAPSSARTGSSPLARGLRRRDDGVGRTVRIIPARAGFTVPARRRPCRGRDHPRSRGVYGPSACPAGRASGSSPLARGLPAPVWPAASRAWIIPARAGFTRSSRSPPTRASDHPRSRGVYAPSWGSSTIFPGSSPLARGLRPGAVWACPRPRIIPARAGFTRSRPSRAARAWDHPRSRGVYPRGPGARRCPQGSSPLARGLRRGRGARGAGVGIIPARAGFTGARR